MKKSRRAPPGSRKLPGICTGSPEKLQVNGEDVSALHVACLYGQLATVQLLVDSKLEWINSRGSRGCRPLHIVLTSKSSATSACLRYLLEHKADVNATDDSGQTPLHLAASEGLLDCVEMLVEAGADVLLKDSIGLMPLDFARIWCHRTVARYLKSCMWQVEKKKEMEERKLAQVLYRDLVDMAEQNKLNEKTREGKMAEWANKKGLPPLKDFSSRTEVTKYHTQCLLPNKSSSNPKHSTGLCKPGHPQQDRKTTTKQPAASSPGPWTIFTGLQPEKPPTEPDLQDSVTLRRDKNSRLLQYTTKWNDKPQPTPKLPLDVLERVLFPRAFPSRIASPQQFKPQNIAEVPHRRRPQGQSTSPWTKVAMHLAEVLEPGHY
ncbi:ankyrin repeat domain-containing protein 53 isoform X2 [Amphiprion ocellaris]|uniref:ankyrin repeat domain-containing protein 53 isoform X2 n=1 Tax=Amphiprion ocellaris TaxID=80972 RepID=UPI002411560B|nr:ankyrin repeat domain-containing protein 53 isoform X2 [Amphiprion ocellaris]